MLRAMLAASLVVGAAQGPADAQAVKAADPAVEMVPAPGYTPREGDA